MGSKKSKGLNHNRHAQAYIREHYDTWEFARKTLRRQYTGPGEFVMRTVAEDLMNGTLDAIAVRIGSHVLLVQWTAAEHSSIRERMLKIEENLCTPIMRHARERFESSGLSPLAEGVAVPIGQLGWERAKRWCADVLVLQLWGWVPRRGFRVWPWNWETWAWGRPLPELLRPPTLTDRKKRSRKASTTKRSERVPGSASL